MRIATWNVNSIRQREPHVAVWLARHSPDLLFLQELKCETANVPAAAFEALGYRVEAVGQKAYNGVAVLGRIPFEIQVRALPGLPEGDVQARYVEVAAGGLIAGGLYLPNGNSGGAAGYAYKLAWLDALHARAVTHLDADTPLILLGDYNVCPADDDFHPGTLPAGDALIRPETRARYRKLLWAGLTDAVRAIHPAGARWTFWDYQAGAWDRDRGLRIDHALLSPTVAERLADVLIDRDERALPQPSDHVPVMVTLTDG